MSRKGPARGRNRVRTEQSAAAAFMDQLRRDHAGLSRVLREVDAQRSMLQTSPETARPVLAEALRYLLIYQHSVHHPREDRLFARIRIREPGRYRRLDRLVREHRSGQRRAEALAGLLARSTTAQLRGRAGRRLANELQEYVAHTREHMRREETLFYARFERALRASDWAGLQDGASRRDPALDVDRLAVRYPRLAARLADPTRSVTGRAGSIGPGSSIVRVTEHLIETCAELAHELLDLVHANLRDARKVRTPLDLLRSVNTIGVRSNRYAWRVITRPFRR